jgi:uncharacterized protein
VASARYRVADARKTARVRIGYARVMQQYHTPFSALSHFAINADDVERARAFYETVLGWRFEAWGPPNFLQIETGAPPRGALQGRRALVEGTRTVGFECSFAVENLEATVASARAAGGTVVMEPVTIPTVGDLAFIQDTEGNVFGAMQYLDGGR